jgi:exosortase
MDQKSEIITGRKTGFLNGRNRWIIFFSILVGLGVTIYAEALHDLYISVIQRHGSSHGLFVPFISGYLIWLKLDRIKGKRPRVDLLTGNVMVAAGCVLFFLGRTSARFSLSILSFLLVVAGLILMFFGRSVFREVQFPLFFLATMIPMPTAHYDQIADWMRQITTWGAVIMLKPFGIALFREGFDIYLRDIHLYVDYHCSGIRVLISYTVFGIAYAFRYKQSFKTRILTVTTAIPLSITHNTIRLFILFLSVELIGPVLSVDFFYHVLFSWSLFAALLIGAIVVDRYLSKRIVKN